ncbi:hypothetical protein WJU16_01005 [Chitinophaga pollutisoli]|uniref:TMhelix containing protein n=1 Tax=Chitinophaga pollutisoli TaxID=3133966 RepID=A0ABZ2YPA6_9BACT
MKNVSATTLAVLLLFATVSNSFFCGILAYNWIDPSSLKGALMFLFSWGAATCAGYLLLSRLMEAVFGKVE